MIIGKNHKGAILTINDRATSRVWIRKLSGKEAIPVAKIAVWAPVSYTHLRAHET